MLKSVLARLLLRLEPEFLAQVEKAKKQAKLRLEEKKLAVLGREQAEFREQEVLSSRQELHDTIERLHNQITTLENDARRKQVRIEELEDIERINNMSNQLLLETVQGELERRTTERLSLQAEKHYLNQQAKRHVPDGTQQPDRER